jgi:hypothetical protein
VVIAYLRFLHALVASVYVYIEYLVRHISQDIMCAKPLMFGCCTVRYLIIYDWQNQLS